jgi:sugar diacid utilization regulator
MIEGKVINELFFAEKQKDAGWQKEDSHICIQIAIEERDSMTSSLNYTCNQLENKFSDSLVFAYEESILMIINLKKAEKKLSDLMSELKLFLREGLFRAGISMVNNNFSRIRELYMQTNLAIKLGGKIHPMYWYFHFDDYVIQAMFYEMSRNISADMYCDKSLYKLLEYDKENGAQLFETLHIYLNSNMNISHTAEKLFLHRSTLLYRLERIYSLTGIDLKHPDKRFHLLLSYYLLKWNHTNNSLK